MRPYSLPSKLFSRFFLPSFPPSLPLFPFPLTQARRSSSSQVPPLPPSRPPLPPLPREGR